MLRGLKLARVHRGWSQTELAARAGLSQPLVCLVESGHVVPSPASLRALAHALNVSNPELLLHEFADPTQAVPDPPDGYAIALSRRRR